MAEAAKTDTKADPKPAAAAEEAPKTRTIAVFKPFLLTLDDGSKIHYGVGKHENVPVAVADHWYAKLHISEDGKLPVAPALPLGDPATVARVQAGLNDANQRLNAENVELKRQLEEAQARVSELEKAAEDAAKKTAKPGG